MTSRTRHTRLSANAVAAAKPRAREYTLWDGSLSHFGVRVQPSGVKSFIVQTRAQGRMRKITLGRYPEMGIEKARREAAAVLVRLWGGEDVAPPRKTKAPLFCDFAALLTGGGIMLHAERPDGPVAAAQKCATHGPLSVVARGGGCTAWSSMRRFDWRLSRRV